MRGCPSRPSSRAGLTVVASHQASLPLQHHDAIPQGVGTATYSWRVCETEKGTECWLSLYPAIPPSPPPPTSHANHASRVVQTGKTVKGVGAEGSRTTRTSPLRYRTTSDALCGVFRRTARYKSRPDSKESMTNGRNCRNGGVISGGKECRDSELRAKGGVSGSWGRQ